MNFEDYKKRVIELSCLTEDKLFFDHPFGAVEHCFPSEERMNNIRNGMLAFCMDPRKGRDGLVEFYDISEAKKVLDDRNKNIYNWHYDRKASTLIVNLELGSHEHLCAALYNIYNNVDTGFIGKDFELAAEKFIDEGYGWFKSTQSYGRALKGKNVKLNTQEKRVFGNQFYES